MASIHIAPPRLIAMNATAKTPCVYVGPPRSAPMVPAAMLAAPVSKDTDPISPIRTSTAGAPKTVSSATATRATARDGPIAETAPARKEVLSSAGLTPAAGAATRAART